MGDGESPGRWRQEIHVGQEKIGNEQATRRQEEIGGLEQAAHCKESGHESRKKTRSEEISPQKIDGQARGRQENQRTQEKGLNSPLDALFYGR